MQTRRWTRVDGRPQRGEDRRNSMDRNSPLGKMAQVEEGEDNADESGGAGGGRGDAVRGGEQCVDCSCGAEQNSRDGTEREESAMRVQSRPAGDGRGEAAAELGVGERGPRRNADQILSARGGLAGGFGEREDDLVKRQ